MNQHRVLLICQLPLLCEGVQHLIQGMDDVQLVTLDCVDPGLIESCLQDFAPATVLIATERADAVATRLIPDVLNHWPDISIIWIGLEENSLRVYTSQILPANSQQLTHAIRRMGAIRRMAPIRQAGRDARKGQIRTKTPRRS
jgi:hypothetical protein